jgi:hypothetical protein
VTATHGGGAVRLAASRSAVLATGAAALALGHAAPGDLTTPADPGVAAATDAELAGRLGRAAERAGAVSRVSSLVAHGDRDGFGRDRLALARKWGTRAYGRVAPPGEGPIAAPVDLRLHVAEPPGAGVGRAGALDQAIVAAVLARQLRPRAQVCYREAVRREPGATGTLTVRLEMARAEVQHAAVTGLGLSNPALRRCLVDAAYAVQVPPIALGIGETVFVASYTLRFRVQGRTASVDEVGSTQDGSVPGDLPGP